MDEIVSLCKRRGFLFQSSEIYGGLNGFWDYGPLGVELKRNVKDAWWRDMVAGHNDLEPPAGAPEAYEMVGLDCTIIMHPQVWKVSGHYDLFVDKMVDCTETKKRYRYDQVHGRWVQSRHGAGAGSSESGVWQTSLPSVFVTSMVEDQFQEELEKKALKYFGLRSKNAADLNWKPGPVECLTHLTDFTQVLGPDASRPGTLLPPRDFNLMFKTIIGALGTEEDAAFLRPETAQGIFVNFKNVLDSTRVRIPFGIAQTGKSFRNEITPRNFTFRSREFEQMEIEFFCHPQASSAWYQYWRDRRMKWYTDLGLSRERLRLREHEPDELSHYSCGTSDIEYAFPFLQAGQFGELEGIAHRGDFDLRSHIEGKLDEKTRPLQVELGADGKPKWRGSGKDLSYRDDLTNERYIPHVIEPSAGADRGTLAFLCEAYCEDEAPDENGKLQKRTVMRLHPRLAPIKAAVFPLVKKDGMPEMAKRVYLELKQHFNVFYDEKGAVGRRYRRQDEAGTPYCITVDGQSLADQTVTIRDRDSLCQERIHLSECLAAVQSRMSSA
ncbi:MAG TPA: glycine--tRNA ligase [Pirellulaceae bacterium]|nr:glycine--tRNA ligase [Pirellulaceae bacterium]